VDDIVGYPRAATEILFFVWVTLNEQKWVTFGERRGPWAASAKRARRFLFRNEIPQRFQQHVLLGSPEIDFELLKCNKDGITGIEISSHMQLCMTAGRACGPGDANDLG
jgi:hypothetical protein